MKSEAQREYDRIQAIEATSRLSELLGSLQQRLANAAVAAHVFAIPTQTWAEDEPPTRPVAEQHGPTAIDAACQVLTRTEYDDEQHAKATVRCPGILQVAGDWSDTVMQVNQTKGGLRSAMQTLGYAAWRQWRTEIPAWQRLNRLQAYREWRWITDPMAVAGFVWAGHNVGGEQLRIGALMARLKDQQDRGGAAVIEAELDRLAGFDPDEVVVIRRPVAPNPQANIRFADKTRGVCKTALPILTNQPLPTIKPLRDFDPDERNARRNDTATENVPLVAHLYAYRYERPYRFRLRVDPRPVRVRREDDGALTIMAGKNTLLRADDPGRPVWAAVVNNATSTRGAIRPQVHVWLNDLEVHLVAANKTNVFFDATDGGVWRVPIKDLAVLTQP